MTKQNVTTSIIRMEVTLVQTFATVSDLRDTAAFVKRVEQADGPVHVMKGRERKLVVMSSELFERYERLDALETLDAKLREAEADVTAGRVRPINDVQRDMRTKYGL